MILARRLRVSVVTATVFFVLPHVLFTADPVFASSGLALSGHDAVAYFSGGKAHARPPSSM